MGEVTLVVEIASQAEDALPREDAEYLALMLGEFYVHPVSENTCKWGGGAEVGIRGNEPAGASLQNASRSSLRKACTPVRLRWVRRGHEFRSLMMLCNNVRYHYYDVGEEGRGH